MTTSGQTPWARDRCEVCTRVITVRAHPKKRRCRDCLNAVALFPASVCKKSKRGNGSRGKCGGER